MTVDRLLRSSTDDLRGAPTYKISVERKLHEGQGITVLGLYKWEQLSELFFVQRETL